MITETLKSGQETTFFCGISYEYLIDGNVWSTMYDIHDHNVYVYTSTVVYMSV